MSRIKMLLVAPVVALVLTVAGGVAFGGTAFANPDAGTLGEPNCHGETVSLQAKFHGGLKKAAADHGFDSVEALQEAIRAICEEDNDG